MYIHGVQKVTQYNNIYNKQMIGVCMSIIIDNTWYRVFFNDNVC